jgi:LPXTG-motif cell wall-anchored protein
VSDVAQTGGESDSLPLIGAAGVGLLALLGGGVVLVRRRRRSEEEDSAADAPVTEPLRIADLPPVTPDGSSAFNFGGLAADAEPHVAQEGRHVRAAFRGPTPDNPSPSLKARLKRGRLFDERERKGRTAPAQGVIVAAMTAHAARARERTGKDRRTDPSPAQP